MRDSRITDFSTVESPPYQPDLDYDSVKDGELIGSGGQAIVRRAVILGSESSDIVAVKEPQVPSRTLDKGLIESFFEEADTWRTLARREREQQIRETDHIVGVVSIGDSQPWIAMEYMDGGSLADRLKSSPQGLPVDEALWITECLCKGLKLAHDSGVAHLDLKPANVLFRETPGGSWNVPKIADWGIARTLLNESGSMDAFSVEYAAPEQFDSDQFGNPDTYTDIYQLGAMVYEMITGSPPYTGGQASIMHDVVYGDDPDPPSSQRDEVPEAVDEVVQRALSTDKSERYRGSIELFEDAVQRLRTDETASKPQNVIGEADPAPSTGSDRSGEENPRDMPSLSQDKQEEKEFYCPECAMTRTDGNSMRAGDICPECNRGYVVQQSNISQTQSNDSRRPDRGANSAPEARSKGSDVEGLDESLANGETQITVVGCGGAGISSIHRLSEKGISGVKLVAADTDIQHLRNIECDEKVLLGKEKTQGRNAGSLPQVGEEAAIEVQEEIQDAIRGSDMVFVTAGLGGGTGTGSAPVVAETARETGALTVGIVTTPFTAEGEVRRTNAEAGLERLRDVTDTAIILQNDWLLEEVGDLPLQKAFSVMDGTLAGSVKGITELITKPGLVNVDFPDMRTVMEKGGAAMIGIGESDSDSKAQDSVKSALRSTHLDADISDADSALISITGGPKMSIDEAEKTVDEIYDRVSSDARIIWGASVNEEFNTEMRTMIVVTGVDEPDISPADPA